MVQQLPQRRGPPVEPQDAPDVHIATVANRLEGETNPRVGGGAVALLDAEAVALQKAPREQHLKVGGVLRHHAPRIRLDVPAGREAFGRQAAREGQRGEP